MTGIFSKPSTPNVPPPPVAPTQTNSAAADNAAAAAQQALLARGRASTVLTGGQGVTSNAPTSSAKLLGNS